MGAANSSVEFGMVEIDIYWSIRSPFSCIATPEMLKLWEDLDGKINFKNLYPAAIRNRELFTNSNKHFIDYLVIYAKRRAASFGMPFKWPDPDPIIQNVTTREIAKDQPNISEWIFSWLKLSVMARVWNLLIMYHPSSLAVAKIGTKNSIWNPA